MKKPNCGKLVDKSVLTLAPDPTMAPMDKRTRAPRQARRADPAVTRSLATTSGRTSADEAIAFLLGLMLARLDGIEARLDRVEAIKRRR